MKVIQNGLLVDLVDSRCNDKGWMEGAGVFETIRTVNNAPWALSRHMRRAVNSAKQLGFSIASEEVLRSAVALLCEVEKAQWECCVCHLEMMATGRRFIYRTKPIPSQPL